MGRLGKVVLQLEDGSEINLADLFRYGGDAMTPIDLQSRYQKTVQTHNAVSIAQNATTLQSSFMDVSGFSEIAVTLVNDAAISNALAFYWSNDGVNIQGYEQVLPSAVPGANYTRSGNTTVKAKFLKIGVTNGDTNAVAHIMSAWAYLKV